MKSKQDASLKDQVASLQKSYKEAVDTIAHQEFFLKKTLAEIDQLKLNTSQSIKRTEEIQEKILHTKQEFMDYQRMCMENACKVIKITEEKLPNWLLDKIQEKINAKTEKVAETLPPVNEVTPAGSKDNKEANPKLEIHFNNVPENALSDDHDVNKCEKKYSPDGRHKADGHLNDGTTSEVCILLEGCFTVPISNLNLKPFI